MHSLEGIRAEISTIRPVRNLGRIAEIRAGTVAISGLADVVRTEDAAFETGLAEAALLRVAPRFWSLVYRSFMGFR